MMYLDLLLVMTLLDGNYTKFVFVFEEECIT